MNPKTANPPEVLAAVDKSPSEVLKCTKCICKIILIVMIKCLKSFKLKRITV